MRKQYWVCETQRAHPCNFFSARSAGLTPYSSPYCVVGSSQDKDNFRRDYCFNIFLNDQFWQKWLEFYLHWQKGRKKWLKMVQKARPIGKFNLNGRCIKTRQIPTWEGAGGHSSE